MKSHSSKSITKISMLITIIIIILSSVLVFVWANGNEDNRQNGAKDNKIVAVIDGEKITKEGFEAYKLLLTDNEKVKMTDHEILDKIIQRQVIYNQALMEGLSVSEAEVTAAISAAREVIENDVNNAAFLQSISALNCTVDQYWSDVRPVYRKALLCGKYKNQLKEEFNAEKSTTASKKLSSTFDDYYNLKIKELISRAKIESYID